MASSITAENIKLMKSQVLLDTEDGGGAITNHELLDGESNNLFPDTSNLDRVYGRINLRKAFVSVQTADNDSLYGANVIVSKRPADQKIDVTLFSPGEWFDRRKQAQNSMEQYLTRGVVLPGHLLEKQLKGQRSIQIAMRLSDEVPAIDQCLCLLENEGKSSEIYQYVRVSKVSTRNRVFTVDSSKEVTRKIVTLELSNSLANDFNGCSVADYEKSIQPAAIVRDTHETDIARYYGARPLAEAVKTGDSQLMTDSVYAQLVPTTTTETPITRATMASGKAYAPTSSKVRVIVKVAGSSSSSATVINLKTSVVPGSVQLSGKDYNYYTFSSRQLLRDDGRGKILYIESGLEQGRIDYETGVINLFAGYDRDYSSIYVDYQQAVTVTSPTHSDMIRIGQNTRGYAYTRTLIPKPMPGTLTVSYEAFGKIYELRDDGRGKMTGADDSFGVGKVDYETGIVQLTTGAIPDMDSAVLFSWCANASSVLLSNDDFPLEGKIAIPLPEGVSAIGTFTKNGQTAVSDGITVSGSLFTGVYNPLRRRFEVDKIPASTYVASNQNVSYTYSGQERVSTPFSDIPYRRVLPGSVHFHAGVATKTMADQSSPWAINKYVRTIRYDSAGLAFPVKDDGDGNMIQQERVVGTVDYATGAVQLNMGEVLFRCHVTEYFPLDNNVGAGMVRNTYTTNYAIGVIPSDASVSYIPADSETLSGQTALVPQCFFFKTPTLPGYASLPPAFRLNNTDIFYFNDKYVEYLTGYVFNFDEENHEVTYIYNNSVPVGNPLKGTFLGAALVREDEAFVSEMHFRSSIRPLRPNSVQLVYTQSGQSVSVYPDEQGQFQSDRFKGFVDYESGLFSVRFGFEVADNETNRTDFGLTSDDFEDGKAWISVPTDATGLYFNAVGYRYVPQDASLLGIDPVRLPISGKVPIYRDGDIVIVHHTQKTKLDNPSAGSRFSVGRERLSALKLMDANGVYLPASWYASDLDAGQVVLSSDFGNTSWQAPLFAEHRIEDMAMISEVLISGRISLMSQLSHDYPAKETLVSSALVIGDLHSRAYNFFVQSSWTNVWSESSTSVLTAAYDTANYPVELTNNGALQERWAIIFTSSTAFRVVGEHVGQIATGSILTDLSPVNHMTNLPYFTIKAGGWGGGWASGNVLRFNTAAANYPVWISRSVLPGSSEQVNDRFCLMVRGDVDR